MIFGAKNYFWCSCGMSMKQPFCDSSHTGTLFKPLKFSLDEKSKSMHLCGCKLSSKAPFCDGVTCEKLLNGESIKAFVDRDLISDGESEEVDAAAEESTK